MYLNNDNNTYKSICLSICINALDIYFKMF